MLYLMMYEYGERLDDEFIVIFCNTGKERNETLDFVHEVETKWNVKIVWLEYDRILASKIPSDIFPTKLRNKNLKKSADAGEETHWFKIVDYESASRKGEPFDKLLNWMSSLPNVVSRGCSMQLKIRTAMRYLFSTGLKQYESFIGIRHDEKHRAIQILGNCDKFEHPKFPLCEQEIDEAKVLEFWKINAFDLKLRSYEGNCDLCFLKAKWKRILLVRENPDMVNWWKAWEAKKSAGGEVRNGRFFRLGEPYEKIEELAHEKTLFDLVVDTTEKDIPCSCAEKAFEKGSKEL